MFEETFTHSDRMPIDYGFELEEMKHVKGTNDLLMRFPFQYIMLTHICLHFTGISVI